jgi:NAD(P)H-binding
MTTAVIGATGRVGSEVVRGLPARGETVTALVRDAAKAHRAFGQPAGLRIRPTRLDDLRDLSESLGGIRTVFIGMGSIGIAGALQRIAINAAAEVSSIEQVTRLSVLNTSADSLGINQACRRRHGFVADQLSPQSGRDPLHRPGRRAAVGEPQVGDGKTFSDLGRATQLGPGHRGSRPRQRWPSGWRRANHSRRSRRWPTLALHEARLKNQRGDCRSEDHQRQSAHGDPAPAGREPVECCQEPRDHACPIGMARGHQAPVPV